MKYQGRIQQWDDAKGFGFVEPNGGGIRAFAHIKALTIAGDICVFTNHSQTVDVLDY